MYTRDTAFSTWPTNCTGQQRGAQLSAFRSAWLQKTSMHKSLQRLLLLQKIIFGKKTSFLEIIDYYTILCIWPIEYPSSLVHHPVKSSHRLLLLRSYLVAKRSGSPQFNASDRWLTCMQCKYRRRRGADRRRRALSDHQMLWRASYCFPFVHHGNIMTMITYYMKSASATLDCWSLLLLSVDWERETEKKPQKAFNLMHWRYCDGVCGTEESNTRRRWRRREEANNNNNNNVNT